MVDAVSGRSSLQPMIMCPTIMTSASSSLTFDCPVLINFPNNDSVNVTYSTYDGVIGTFPLSSREHTLDDFVIGSTQVIVEAEDTEGNKAVCYFTYQRLKPMILCPTIMTSASSSLTFDSPRLINFPNNDSVTVTYSTNEGVIGTFPLSSGEHTLDDFVMGSTQVMVEAEDTEGNKAACCFTYQRLQPTIMCPTIMTSASSSLTFDSPRLINFPDNDSVTVTYSTNEGVIGTFPLSSGEHTLDDFVTGSTQVMVEAEDTQGNKAACYFTYQRLQPMILCPTIMTSASSSLTFDSPRLINFPNNDSVNVTYSTYDGVIGALPLSSGEHTLHNFVIGSTQVMVEAEDTQGNKAACYFTYQRLQPMILCPTIMTSASSSLTFDSPRLINFPNNDSVTVTYSTNEGVIGTFPLSSREYTLDDFVIGSTQVMVEAEDAEGNKAVCYFTYQRLQPMILCPTIKTSTSSSVTFDSPRLIKFPNNDYVNVTYSTNEGVIGTFPLSSGEHTLDDFVIGSTEVMVEAEDTEGNKAVCYFTYQRLPWLQGTVKLK